MKTILNILIIFTVTACVYPPAPDFQERNYNITLDGRLPAEDGYYHLRLDRFNYQTLHRLQGQLTATNGRADYPQMVHWESSHYWWYEQGDTAVTVIRRNVNDDGYWVNVDTLHWTAPDSLLVPTVNPSSYTDDTGEFSGMIGPVIDMLGDTMTVRATWYSKWYESDTVSTFIQIILE